MQAQPPPNQSNKENATRLGFTNPQIEIKYLRKLTINRDDLNKGSLTVIPNSIDPKGRNMYEKV